MTEGLAKAAPKEPTQVVENKEVAEVKTNTTPPSFDQWDGIPMDVLRHYGVEISKTDRKTFDDLRYISEFIKESLPEDKRDLSNIMTELRRIERGLVRPHWSQKPYICLYNYARISKQIKQLEKERTSL